MSLKYIHLFFIMAAVSISLYFGAWAVHRYFVTKDVWMFVWGVMSLVVAQVLVPYGVWFWKKSKKEGL